MLCNECKQGQKGFSLVELSIVLVILGLLIAGVIAGSTLVRNAELRAVTAEFNDIRTNINAFKTTYDALPGDMPNANEFWPVSNVNCESALEAEMNGDFNGRIEFKDVDGRNESYMAWCHLRLANLGSGPFQGNPDDEGDPELGVDVPTSKVAGGGYFFAYGAHELADTNVLVLGGFSDGTVVGTGMLLGAVLTPRDARNIDNKIDDGYPTSGIVRGFDDDNAETEAECVDLSPPGGTAPIYSISINPQPIGCGLAFRLN